MNKLTFAAFAAVLVLAGQGCPGNQGEPPAEPDNAVPDEQSAPQAQLEDYSGTPGAFPGVLPAEEIQNKRVRLATDKGEIVFETFADTAPMTVSNFIGLAKNDFYDDLSFHRREEGFVIQGGDPNGNGTGGPGYTFEDELDDSYGYERGIVAMANRGPDTNGSQFFIMLGDVPLPKDYTVFGRVTEGMDVVDQIAVGDKILEVSVETR